MKYFTIGILSLINLICVTSHPLNRKVLSEISNMESKEQFKNWHFILNKTYDLNSKEGVRRYKIYKKNLSYIQETNSKHNQFVLGIGPYTDLTNEEYQSMFNINEVEIKSNLKKTDIKEQLKGWDDDDDEMNEVYNWEHLFENSTRQHESAYSSSIYAALNVFEAHSYLFSGKYNKLSLQVLKDCVQLNYDRIETPTTSINMATYFGFPLESDYPTINGFGECKKNYPVHTKAVIPYLCLDIVASGFNQCNKSKIGKALKRGPYISKINGRAEELQHYKSGVVSLKGCENDNNFGAGIFYVAVIGINSEYFTILTSNGSNWGMNGKAYIDRENSCYLWRYVVAPIGVYSYDAIPSNK